MCCYTHDVPVVDGYGGQVAGREEFRCRCGYGGLQCVRQATQEDRLCDRCRAPEPEFAGGPDFYAAGRVGGFLADSEFSPPLRYERSLVQDYRIGLTVAQPSAVTVVTGI